MSSSASASARSADGVSASRRPVQVNLGRFAQCAAVMATVVRAQYLFRANKRSYEMLQRAKRNKQKRMTELDMARKLQAKVAAAPKTGDSKFSADELAERANKLAAEQEAARAARAVLSTRRENSALSAVHADLAAAHEKKRAAALEAQRAKSHAEMLAKISKLGDAPSEASEARRAAADIVRQRVQDPLHSALSKDIKARGQEHALRAEAVQTIRQRQNSALIGALNAEIARPENAQRLRSVLDQAQIAQDQALQEKLKNPRRATARPQDFAALKV